MITAITLSIEVGQDDPYVRAAFRPESLGLSSAAFSSRFNELVARRWSALLYRAIERGEARADLDVAEASRWLMNVEFVLGLRGDREVAGAERGAAGAHRVRAARAA